jgi:carboxyl-terminal processing protease
MNFWIGFALTKLRNKNYLRLTSGLLLLLIGIVAHAQAALSPAERLSLSARVWGLLKYHSPVVAACQRNWDQVLLDALPGIEAASVDVDFNARMTELIAKAGAVPNRVPGAVAPTWIEQSVFSSGNQAALAAFASQNVSGRCYVRPFFDTQLQLQFTQADFSADTGFNTAPMSRNIRLLAAFRFWNAAEYYFAYKSQIGRAWESVLVQYVVAIADAQTPLLYAQLMRQFTAELNDSHGFFASPNLPNSASPPFQLSRVEQKILVTARLAQAGVVAIGDALITVNGRAIDGEINAQLPYAYGSNPAFRQAEALRNAAGGALASKTYGFQRANGDIYSVSATASAAFEAELARGLAPSWRFLAANSTRSCAITQVNLGRLQPSETTALLDAARRSDLVVIDVRQYPNSPEAFVALADTLLPSPVIPAAAQTPDYSHPGSYLSAPDAELLFGGATPNGFQGRILLLANEQSISFSEFVAMVFQTQPKTLVVGSQTAGADGEIAFGLFLPGAIQTSFSSNRIRYPDGTPTQRVGIVPNIQAIPTITGIRAGRDELLDIASDCQWKTTTPAPRRPRSGLYYDPTRNGEGIDTQLVGATYGGFTYAYDDDRYPVWGLSTSRIENGLWNAPLDRVLTGGQLVNAGNTRLDFQRGPYSTACAVSDQSQVIGRASFAWPPINPNRELCVQPIIYSDQSAYSGLWSGPSPEYGWGLSLHHNGENLVLYLYAQDAHGQARWMIGNVPWNGVGEVRVPMLRVRGFCSTCAPTAVGIEDGGLITLNLTNATPGVTAGNTVTIDVQFHDGGVWKRDRMPMSKL